MNGSYSLAEILASGCPVEMEDTGEPCDRCDGPGAVVLTPHARLCGCCHDAVYRGSSTGYARLSEQRYREWLDAVREGFDEGLFDELDGELDDALEDVAGWEAERMLRGRR